MRILTLPRLGLVPDQQAQVGRRVQDQRNVASKVDNQRSTVAHFGMEQKPVPDQKPLMIGDQKGMDKMVGLEGYKGSRGISCQSWEGLRAKDLLRQVESAEPNGRNNVNLS